MSTETCECALDKGRIRHRDDCPVAPGEVFRITGDELMKRLEGE